MRVGTKRSPRRSRHITAATRSRSSRWSTSSRVSRRASPNSNPRSRRPSRKTLPPPAGSVPARCSRAPSRRPSEATTTLPAVSNTGPTKQESRATAEASAARRVTRAARSSTGAAVPSPRPLRLHPHRGLQPRRPHRRDQLERRDDPAVGRRLRQPDRQPASRDPERAGRRRVHPRRHPPRGRLRERPRLLMGHTAIVMGATRMRSGGPPALARGVERRAARAQLRAGVCRGRVMNLLPLSEHRRRGTWRTPALA